MMAQYKGDTIQLEDVHKMFGSSKSYPDGLFMPEVQKCEFHVLSDGSAEIFFDVVTDTTVPIHLHITEERALDCVAHSGVADVSNGMLRFGSAGWNGVDGYDAVVYAKISADYVKQLLWEHSRALILSYICLFRIGGEAQ